MLWFCLLMPPLLLGFMISMSYVESHLLGENRRPEAPERTVVPTQQPALLSLAHRHRRRTQPSRSHRGAVGRHSTAMLARANARH
jgi:hypothetical protein